MVREMEEALARQARDARDQQTRADDAIAALQVMEILADWDCLGARFVAGLGFFWCQLGLSWCLEQGRCSLRRWSVFF
jgi:hypothetical protein